MIGWDGCTLRVDIHSVEGSGSSILVTENCLLFLLGDKETAQSSLPLASSFLHLLKIILKFLPHAYCFEDGRNYFRISDLIYEIFNYCFLIIWQILIVVQKIFVSRCKSCLHNPIIFIIVNMLLDSKEGIKLKIIFMHKNFHIKLSILNDLTTPFIHSNVHNMVKFHIFWLWFSAIF